MTARRAVSVALLLLGALVASSSAASIVVNGFSQSASDATSISYQTSTSSVAFRWDLEGATHPQYAVGFGSFPSAYIPWTDVPNYQNGVADTAGFQSVVASFNANNLPMADLPVVISVRDLDNSTLIVADNSATPLIVGSSDALQCQTVKGGSSMWDPYPVLDGAFVSPPEPYVTTSWNPDTQMFDISASMRYLQFGYTWVIDFAPFADDTSLGTFGLAATNCENRATLDLAGRSFAELWNAALDGESVYLNNPMYLAYQTAANPTWTLAATNDCNNITFTTHLKPSDLASCHDAYGAQSITISSDSSNIIYDFKVFVSAVGAIDPLDASKGLHSVNYMFPFQFTMNINTDNIAGATATQSFAYQIESVGIVQTTVVSGVPEFELKIVVATDTLTSTDYLTYDNAHTYTSLVNNSFAFDTSNLPGQAQKQNWTLLTTVPEPAGTDLSGTYHIQWGRQPSNGLESLDLVLRMTIQNTGKGAIKLNIILDQKTDNTFATQVISTVYTQRSQFYLLSSVGAYDSNNTLQALTPAEQNNYRQTISNVWLCYTIDDSVPKQCRSATDVVRPVVQLVLGGAPNQGPIVNQYNYQQFNNVNGKTTQAGFSIALQPLVAVHRGKIYFEVESTLANNLKRRSIGTIAATPNQLGGFSIQSDATAQLALTGSASSSVVASLVLIIASVAALLFLL